MLIFNGEFSHVDYSIVNQNFMNLSTNMVSTVTLLKVGDRKLMFTGDSGIESFTDQGLLNRNIQNLEFLDLSHHGSSYNSSKELLEHFNPEVVFVSAKNDKNRPSKI